MFTPPFSFVFTCFSFKLLFRIYSSKFPLLLFTVDILFIGDKIGGGGGGGGRFSFTVIRHYSMYYFCCFSCYFNTSMANCLVYAEFYGSIAYFFIWWIKRSVAIIFNITGSFFWASVSLSLSRMSVSIGEDPLWTKLPSLSSCVVYTFLKSKTSLYFSMTYSLLNSFFFKTPKKEWDSCYFFYLAFISLIISSYYFFEGDYVFNLRYIASASSLFL